MRKDQVCASLSPVGVGDNHQTAFPCRFGRQYVAYWEVRNLRMAATIRDMLAEAPGPGMRALVVVGASHKPYLEAYLHQMHDVRIVDIRPMLH